MIYEIYWRRKREKRDVLYSLMNSRVLIQNIPDLLRNLAISGIEWLLGMITYS